MIVAASRADGSGSAVSRAVLLAPPDFTGSGAPLTESVMDWLAIADAAEGASA
jgi:hypothetical protein